MFMVYVGFVILAIDRIATELDASPPARALIEPGKKKQI